MFVDTKGALLDLEKKVIFFERYPASAKIIEAHWVDASSWILLPNYFGSFSAQKNLDFEGTTCHIVPKEQWHEDPLVGRCFYGLIEYVDAATPSDIIKQDDLIREPGVRIFTSDSKVYVSGNVLKKHQGYWVSHPVTNIH